MAVKKAEPKPHGRPAVYSDPIADEICARLSSGDSLKTICSDETMPARSTVYLWLVANEAGFSDKYARAKSAQQEAAVDELAEVAEKTLRGEFDPQAARVYADIIKWRAARLAPKKYGDKVTTEHTGPGGGPVQKTMTVEFVSANESGPG